MLSDVLGHERAYIPVFFITVASGAIILANKKSIERDIESIGGRVIWVEFDCNKGSVPRIERHLLLRPAPATLDEESAA